MACQPVPGLYEAPALAHSRFELGDLGIAQRRQTGSDRDRLDSIALERRLGEDFPQLRTQDLEGFSLPFNGRSLPEDRLERSGKRLLQAVTAREVKLIGHVRLALLAQVPAPNAVTRPEFSLCGIHLSDS